MLPCDGFTLSERSESKGMHVSTMGHIDKLQAGDDKRAVKILVK